MKDCIVKCVNGRWHCYGPSGVNYCSFDRKDWAVECGRANGWNVLFG